MNNLCVGDLVEFSAEFLCRTHVPGGTSPVTGARGRVAEVLPGGLVRVLWLWAGHDWPAGRTTLAAEACLWADGKGVHNECPRCAVGKCGGASAWRAWPIEKPWRKETTDHVE